MSTVSPAKILLVAFLPLLVLGLVLASVVAGVLLPDGCLEVGDLPVECVLVMGVLGSGLPALVLWVFAWSRRDWRSLLYLGSEGAVWGWFRGLLVGVGLALLPLGAALLVGGATLTIAGPEAGAGLGLTVAALALASLAEELVFRGYLLPLLGIGGRGLRAVILSSLLFALLHLGNPGLLGLSALLSSLVGVFAAGLLLGTVAHRDRAIARAWGLHLGWNVSLGCLWGLPVSGLQFPSVFVVTTGPPDVVWGGFFGPESGLAWIVPIMLTVLWMARSKPQARLGAEPKAESPPDADPPADPPTDQRSS